MVTRDFKGFPSIQEVECRGNGLNPEVKLLSLRLYRTSDNFVLASLNVFADSCLTYTDYSSCSVNTRDTHKSRVRVLVSDLEEGGSRRFGCKATVVGSEGEANKMLWSILVTRQSKYRQSMDHVVYFVVSGFYNHFGFLFG